MKKIFIILLPLIILFLGAIIYRNSAIHKYPHLKLMKDVGEAYMDEFGLTDADFRRLKNAEIDVIEGNFDTCASDEDVQYFLDQSDRHDLKVIMPAGSGDAEWGYACDRESYPQDQKPVWQKSLVAAWVNKWKNHPAVYGWDISNEAGSVLPNATVNGEEDKSYFLTREQLYTAYNDVKTADPEKPVMIRMNGWFFYDYDENFFREGNPFTRDVADIVMINAYSNIGEYDPEFVTTVADRAFEAVRSQDPNVQVIVAVSAWGEPPLWNTPSDEQLQNDLAQLADRTDLSGIAFFKYGANESEWYLPDSKIGAPDLWKIIERF